MADLIEDIYMDVMLSDTEKILKNLQYLNILRISTGSFFRYLAVLSGILSDTVYPMYS